MKNLKIFTDNVEDEAIEQIDLLMSQEAFKNSKVRIMPDVHKGKGCVIGFTGDLGNKVIPNIVGVDIGCGMLCVDLGKIEIDYKKLDDFISSNVPSGMNVNSNKLVDFDLTRLNCYGKLKNYQWIENSIGSLGGGNHFIEIDEGQDGDKYLVIHSGSRNLGSQVADYYQDLADKICNYDLITYQKKRNEILTTYKEKGKEKEIQDSLIELKKEYEKNRNKIPYELSYLEGEYRDKYLNDMKICQEFAVLNRYTMAKTISTYMGWNLDNYFESIHNYISFEDNIVRKGAISAKKGEKVIIPINMRDGCIIGVGKGNDDWNNSAPHGAGRIMSRSQAMKKIKLDDYKDSMKNIYTTSVTEDTKDEAPFVYKSLEEILEHIVPTVDVIKVIKPVYNFKAKNNL
jgi:RNA-splicing ligase RtcB